MGLRARMRRLRSCACISRCRIFWAARKLNLFDGFALERTSYLIALTLTFLALIIISGLIKLRINTMKGWMGERMLRRLRYYLFDHILRFPLPTFRRVKSAEMATMIKDEVEPLGGFVGEAIITPLYLGGQALTALFFILFQHIYLGLVAFAMVVLQAVIIPRMRLRLLALSQGAADCGTPAGRPGRGDVSTV